MNDAHWDGWVLDGTTAADTNAYLFEGTCIGTSAASGNNLYRNSVLLGTTTATLTGPNGVCLGGGYQCTATSGFEFSSVAIAEVIYFNAVIPAAQRIAVETYIRFKYNLW
eukprot:m.143575 g.143575  ORF g.143575 m.143575 type:complete len:110 (+) comp14989_c0_seq3:2-331(+)